MDRPPDTTWRNFRRNAKEEVQHRGHRGHRDKTGVHRKDAKSAKKKAEDGVGGVGGKWPNGQMAKWPKKDRRAGIARAPVHLPLFGHLAICPFGHLRTGAAREDREEVNHILIFREDRVVVEVDVVARGTLGSGEDVEEFDHVRVFGEDVVVVEVNGVALDSADRVNLHDPWTFAKWKVAP
jgi:hypothetical protein